ncbi:MAG: PAS domain S-box protein [Planctomycetota bacterium]|nr:MAG: PAS domain S-box protein [Planctomycetota bacterium]
MSARRLSLSRGRSTRAAQDTPSEAGVAQAVLAAALDPIITIDSSGVIHSASDSVKRVFGWRAADLVGRNINVLMPEPHRSAHDGYLDRYRKSGTTHILNTARRFDAVRKDGTAFPIELSISRAEIPGHATPLFVGIIRDLSRHSGAVRGDGAAAGAEEQVRLITLLAEQTSALHEAQQRLHMADRMASIGTLAAGLGHDMNNVLLPVRAHLNAIQAQADQPGVREHVAMVHKSVAYLQQLADGLQFLALDPDSRDSRLAATDLHDWWLRAGSLLTKAVPKHVRTTAAFTPGLPKVGVSAHGLTQAVLNLVVNAGESIPGDGGQHAGHVHIWAEGAEDGTHVRLGVTDNGRGMSEEVRRRAFEIFFTTKPRGLGTGLGLALVRKVVADAGGTVEIQSQPDTGTTVVMVLPVAVAAPRPPNARTAMILLADGRAAALVRQLLDLAGVRTRCCGVPPGGGQADIWVTEPTPSALHAAAAWRTRHPAGCLVLFGQPDSGAAAAWNALHPVTIDDCQDVGAIRTALHRAAGGP